MSERVKQKVTGTKKPSPTDILTKRLSPNEVEWRIASTKSEKYITVVPYINNRCVMNRLDAAFGWDWNSHISFDATKNGFLCTIEVTVDGRKVSRTDGASTTDVEAFKGGISDAMKRAAVQFGIGRELYDYPHVMYSKSTYGVSKYIPKEVLTRLKGLTEALNSGDQLPEVIILK